ncbi:uncharacterized protein LOC144153370 [Haemaphysalis longicornis]
MGIRVKNHRIRVKVKNTAVSKCNVLELEKLAKSIKDCKDSCLSIFFAAKTHKDGIPFRCIVSENGCWQRELSRFLQKHLQMLRVDDPFVVKNSSEVIAYLDNNSSVGSVFSVDIEDLFFSIPHDELLLCVQDCIDVNGATKFQNMTGISVEAFLSLLEFYLSATVVKFSGDLYTQKKGICIGSCVAPILSTIFLSSFDRRLQEEVSKDAVLRIFRYVDDYLICLSKQELLTYHESVEQVLGSVREVGGSLSFTHELQTGQKLRFLDLDLCIAKNHVCWMYCPRATKGLLPFESAHSKTVKRAIAILCLEGALVKSCVHRMEASFDAQLSRLEEAGYPRPLLSVVSESILKKIKHRHSNPVVNSEKKKRPLVVPYMHKVTHNLKRVASRFNVPIVFSAPCKLASLCKRINGKRKTSCCEKKHGVQYVHCRVGVVYKIPLTCGKFYIGQTGRCVNERLREHDLSMKNGTGSHLPHHCRECGKECAPRLEDTQIVGKRRDTVARELREAYLIQKFRADCISEPSLSLFLNEFRFLDNTQ